MNPPGYFDAQVNGYAGVDFNQDHLTATDLRHACQRLAADGVSGFLATIITDHPDSMRHRLAQLVRLRDDDPFIAQLLTGLHIEGPFLNPAPGYRGAHPVEAIQPANLDLACRLVDAGAGLVRLVTLAPEADPAAVVTRGLVAQNIVVAAGHTNATRDQLRRALDAGLTMFTHLGNGCPAELPRHDNIIQRALSLADRLWISFIADGVHIPFFALRNYLAVTGLERVLVTTDAMAAAGLGPGRYTFGRWDVTVGADMVARAPDGSHLIGAAVTMPQSVANLHDHVGVAPGAAHQMASLNPRRALHLDRGGVSLSSR